VSAEERSRLQRILDGGLVDAYRRLHPDDVQYTWWDYRAGHFHKGFGLRIDLILLGEGLADGVRACGIDRNFRKGQKPSDHAPLLVDLDR
jgi:exodeoxyribonuclease III